MSSMQRPSSVSVRKEAAEICQSFTGGIVCSKLNPKAKPDDVGGNPMILLPKTGNDASIAVRLQRLAGADKTHMIVRSGKHSTTNRNEPQQKENGTGNTVVDMRYFKTIALESAAVGHTDVRVGVAVTAQELADFLVTNNLFLPLGDNPSKSIGSSVLSPETDSCLTTLARSAGESLRDHVKMVRFSDETGEFDVANTELPDGVVSTSVLLKCDSGTSSPAKAIWMINYYVPYHPKVFPALISSLFVGGTSVAPTLDKEPMMEHADLAVRVFFDHYGTPMVCVTAAGREAKQDIDEKVMAIFTRDIPIQEGAAAVEVNRVVHDGVQQVVEATMEVGLHGGLQYKGMSCTAYSGKLVGQEDEQNSLTVEAYCHLINLAVGEGDNGEFFPDAKISSSLSLDRAGRVNVKVFLYFPTELRQHDRILQQLVERALPLPQVGGEQQRRAFPDAELQREARKVGDVVARGFSRIAPIENLIPSKAILPLGATRIPNFRGDVFMKVDGDDYKEAAHQYSTSSYDAERTQPYMIAYPKDWRDIAAAIKFAKKQAKNIVPRSGGHQYSCHSSGSGDTIVVSMEAFDKIDVTDNIATVGVGAQLINIASRFNEAEVTIPHGECPFVCIGGHVQSGGYGHLLRSYGLCLDHVKSFDIVLASGQLETIFRPSSDTEDRNNRIYWAVLGGGPGSFGVLTEVVFEAVRDRDHPKSFGYNHTWLYQKSVFYDGLMVVKDWTEKINQTPGLAKDVDLMITVASSDGTLSRPFAGLLFEMVHGNLGGADQDQQAQLQVFDDAISRVKRRLNLVNRFVPFLRRPIYDTRRSGTTIDDDDRRRLAFMSNSFVRQPGTGTTDNGREFKYPYKKRMNSTKVPLTNEFINAFADLVDEIVGDSGRVHLIFQMIVGGGAYRDPQPEGITSISHRDITFGFVFDIFYRPGWEELAEEYQKRMEAILPDLQASDNDEIRMLWGSFADTDMSTVWSKYYNDAKLYDDLQKVKVEVDETDLFHTEFTVQLPTPVEATSAPAVTAPALTTAAVTPSSSSSRKRKKRS